ncbi:hypothetical protein ACFL6S_17405 [Candidatus Poribacteria bacterium]
MRLDYGPDELDNLLERLFADDESTSEDIVVLGRPVPFTLLTDCCSYSYSGYS